MELGLEVCGCDLSTEDAMSLAGRLDDDHTLLWEEAAAAIKYPRPYKPGAWPRSRPDGSVFFEPGDGGVWALVDSPFEAAVVDRWLAGHAPLIFESGELVGLGLPWLIGLTLDRYGDDRTHSDDARVVFRR